MELIKTALANDWNSSFDTFILRLDKAYQEVSHLKNSSFLLELTSISEGCKIPLPQIIALNYVYDIFGGGCTSIVFNNANNVPNIVSNLDFNNGII